MKPAITLKFTYGEKTIELTEEEARGLLATLQEIFGKKPEEPNKNLEENSLKKILDAIEAMRKKEKKKESAPEPWPWPKDGPHGPWEEPIPKPWKKPYDITCGDSEIYRQQSKPGEIKEIPQWHVSCSVN